jgi:hypothetical protein
MPEALFTIIGFCINKAAYEASLAEYNNCDEMSRHIGEMVYVTRTCSHCLIVLQTEAMLRLHQPLCIIDANGRIIPEHKTN